MEKIKFNNKFYLIIALIVLFTGLLFWGIYAFDRDRQVHFGPPDSPISPIVPFSRIQLLKQYDIPRLFIPPNEPVFEELQDLDKVKKPKSKEKLLR